MTILHRLSLPIIGLFSSLFVTPAGGATTQVEAEELAEITVLAERISNENPSDSYATLATALRFLPSIDLQARGLPEGQGDITVRGGLFENTGVKIGAVNLFDPQTGHYVSDVPIAPEFLSAPTLHVGVANTIAGFNSSVATLAYPINEIVPGGHVSLGFGTDQLNYQTFSVADFIKNPGTERPVAQGLWAGALSLAHSKSDNTASSRDHQFKRVSTLLQRQGDHNQSEVMVAYQDKFYGWPGAYTGFASLNETDQTQSTLVLLNHRQWQGDGNEWAIGAFYRQLEDDYDFDRFTVETGVPGAFEHETRAYAISAQGNWRVRGVDWRYSAQLTGDKLVRSTDLVEGDFNSRRYLRLGLVPSKHIDLTNGSQLIIEAGLSFDSSNRDSSALSPLLGATYEIPGPRGVLRYRLEYASTTQLPGYTVLKSRPAGLFGGNAALGREKAKTLEFTIKKESTDWLINSAVFVRQDDDLVDWTFLSGAPFARQANAVDIDVIGAEFVLTRQWLSTDLALGYAYLHKDADYGDAAVDASYYALNYADHRITLTARHRPFDGVEFRVDGEFRDQHDNPLRSQTGNTYYLALGVSWRPIFANQLVFNLTGTNLTDSEFEAFPGTPAPDRQISISGRYDW